MNRKFRQRIVKEIEAAFKRAARAVESNSGSAVRSTSMAGWTTRRFDSRATSPAWWRQSRR